MADINFDYFKLPTQADITTAVANANMALTRSQQMRNDLERDNLAMRFVPQQAQLANDTAQLKYNADLNAYNQAQTNQGRQEKLRQYLQYAKFDVGGNVTNAQELLSKAQQEAPEIVQDLVSELQNRSSASAKAALYNSNAQLDQLKAYKESVNVVASHYGAIVKNYDNMIELGRPQQEAQQYAQSALNSLKDKLGASNNEVFKLSASQMGKFDINEARKEVEESNDLKTRLAEMRANNNAQSLEIQQQRINQNSQQFNSKQVQQIQKEYNSDKVVEYVEQVNTQARSFINQMNTNPTGLASSGLVTTLAKLADPRSVANVGEQEAINALRPISSSLFDALNRWFGTQLQPLGNQQKEQLITLANSYLQTANQVLQKTQNKYRSQWQALKIPSDIIDATFANKAGGGTLSYVQTGRSNGNIQGNFTPQGQVQPQQTQAKKFNEYPLNIQDKIRQYAKINKMTEDQVIQKFFSKR